MPAGSWSWSFFGPVLSLAMYCNAICSIWKFILLHRALPIPIVSNIYIEKRILFIKVYIYISLTSTIFFSQYDVVRRVRELNILGLTAEYGILSKLENLGLDLAAIEELLPAIEETGALNLVASNQQILVNGIAPLLVEAAPLLLPVVAGALGVGAPAFFLTSAALAGADFALFANDVTVPFIGLPAGVLAGLLLVPLSVVTGGLGVFLSGLKK